MINIVFELSHKPDKPAKYRMTIKGHADEGTTDDNLKCASATALAYALGQTIVDAHKFEHLKNEPIVSLAIGDAEITAEPKKGHEITVWCAFRTICNGFRVLSGNYPESYHLEVK